ncbi:MAG: hypothetical protein ABIE36_03815, partial [Candidatus Diapherotrites archaeon]
TCNSTGQCVTTCTDTCLSLGYSCGTHTICGSSVNCGTCTLPQTCNTTNQCSTSAQTWTWTNELITNGGFEDGDLTGWIEENGDYGQGFSVGNHMGNSQYVLPQSGSYQAWDDGASSDASGVDFYLYQDVNLGSYASYIDAGNAKMNASGWGATSEKTGGADTTRIQFIFLDISHNELETAINSGWIYWVNGTWWKRGVTNYNIPVNTRYIRVWASSYENCGGDYCDSGTWDSFSVKLGYFA